MTQREVETFPTYGCFTDQNNANTMFKAQGYLGLKYERNKRDTIVGTYILSSHEDMRKFTRWWIVKLNYGAKEFEIKTLFLGATSKLVVRMVNDLSVKLLEGNFQTGHWEIPLKLEVLYSEDELSYEKKQTI